MLSLSELKSSRTIVLFCFIVLFCGPLMQPPLCPLLFILFTDFFSAFKILWSMIFKSSIINFLSFMSICYNTLTLATEHITVTPNINVVRPANSVLGSLFQIQNILFTLNLFINSELLIYKKFFICVVCLTM